MKERVIGRHPWAVWNLIIHKEWKVMSHNLATENDLMMHLENNAESGNATTSTMQVCSSEFTKQQRLKHE